MGRSMRFLLAASLWLAAGLVLAVPAWGWAQGGETLGSVQVTRAVLANGQPLAPGEYVLRLSKDVPTPVAGQTPGQSRWVEFVQGNEVKGREIATVLTTAELKAVLPEPMPEAGTSKTQLLRGGDYLRVWVNHDGTHYLLHLAVR
jgi:hypothetical protein